MHEKIFQLWYTLRFKLTAEQEKENIVLDVQGLLLGLL